jgi:hypothetical protein
MVRGMRGRWRVPAALVIVGVVLVATATLTAQTRFQLYMYAQDDTGAPVRDLKAIEVQMREDGQPGEIVTLEPFSLPVKVTVLVDNKLADDDGLGGGALVHLRSGLARFFDTLPRDVEVSLIATAPNPRWLVRPTTDPVQIEKGLSLITPDAFPARFTDALIEYAHRLDADFRDVSAEHEPDYVPVLVVIGSTTADASHIQRDAVIRMITSLRDHRVETHFLMFTPSGPQGLGDGAPVLIAKAAQEVTGGRYEALAGNASSSLNRLLPQMAASIANRHTKQTAQYKVTIERPSGAHGPVRDFDMTVTRAGVAYQLSIDGSLR